MQNSCQVINIDDIGSILLERSKRARRVVISIRPIKGVRVAVPDRVSFRDALKFVHLKKTWIKKHLDRMEKYHNQRTSLEDCPTIDRTEAREVLTTRLAQLAKQHGFRYNKVSIRNQRTRWGSCSSRNNLSLNVRLMSLTQELVDYVLLHELVHTRIHDHSKRFWKELDKYVGDGKEMASRLSQSTEMTGFI
jgi:predicted metal-dependent hydrolase